MEPFIKVISRNTRSADLEKSGRLVNRVIKWGRDSITIEADKRRVKGGVKGS